MKTRFLRILSGIILAGFLGSSSLPAVEIAESGTPARKLQRGFLNVALSPIELSNELARDKKEESFVPTWFTGFGRGSLFMIGRAMAGVYDLVTAPVPLPSEYSPLVYPEFAWEHLEENPPS